VDSFSSLYVVWTLEPDYARKDFINKYGDLEGFIKKWKPTTEELEKAKEIYHEQANNRKEVVQGCMGELNRDLRGVQTTLSFDKA
jgi:hypothetical protein